MLHIGSLATALASFLDARAHRGVWLVRIEDLDGARAVPGAAEQIVRSLARVGLESDEPVVFQSQRIETYRQHLHELRVGNLTYECSCTRVQLAAAPENIAGDGHVYPGFCRSGPRQSGATATRLRIATEVVEFDDRLQGRQCVPLARLGDPIIRRRDDVVAYQLAVVIDDGWQRISDVVRGADLLMSTAWQILLQQALHVHRPRYLHLPLVVEPDGSKLAKSRRSLPAESLHPSQALMQALRLLHQAPPAALDNAPVPELLAWAIAHWRPETLQGIHLLRLPSPD